MIAVGIKELKEGLSRYVKQAAGGEEVVVTDHGKEVALLVPITAERKAVRALLDAGKARWTGGKPSGMRGIAIKGKSLSETVKEDRR